MLRDRLIAVPNGGARDAITGAKLKDEGVTPGVADLILFVRTPLHGALLIEMKTPTGRLSQSQREWSEQLTAEGDYSYNVARSLDEFAAIVTAYIAEAHDHNLTDHLHR